MLRLLFHVGRAVAHQGLGQIAQALADPTLGKAGDLLGKIAYDAWNGIRKERKQDRLNADVLDAARMDAGEIRRQAAEIAAAVAPDDAELQDQVERFVTLVPASIRATLRRAEDPTGTSLPFDYAIVDESDIAKLLPVRFPRAHFRPGYAPPFLRGWELVEQIGAGGFGEVWKVRNLRANQLVGAVKFGHALNDAELSLLNEGDVLNRLLAHGRHPGIVELQDVWADGDEVPWLRYEYVPGGDMTGLIHRWTALPMAERLPPVLAAFRELCVTVGHFHRLTPAVVHRDLKPSNILVAADGRLKVGDFGIGSVSAKRILDGERLGTLSRTNTVQAYLRAAHTPLYAPPEQKSDPKHRPQPTDDVHALGVILFQMLTGRLDAAPGARFDRDLTGVPREIVELIGDCVDAEKDRRPRSALDVGIALQQVRVPSLPLPIPFADDPKAGSTFVPLPFDEPRESKPTYSSARPLDQPRVAVAKRVSLADPVIELATAPTKPKPDRQPRKRRSRRGSLLVLAAMFLIVASLVTVIVFDWYPDHQDKGNLKQIGLAVQNYHSAQDQFPPPFTVGPDGKLWTKMDTQKGWKDPFAKDGWKEHPSPQRQPLLSWRVLLLPYLEKDGLFRKFKLDEPWDSDHNQQVFDANPMPEVFRYPGDDATAKLTRYRVFVDPPRDGKGFGPMTTFGDGQGTSRHNRDSIFDGPANTIAVATAATAVPWTKPDELTFEYTPPTAGFGGITRLPSVSLKPLKPLLHFRNGRCNILMFDESVQTLKRSVSEAALSHAITKSGGEVYSFDQ